MDTTQPEASDTPARATIESTVSACLAAVARANAAMSREQTALMLEQCFHETADGYRPVMIRMALARQVVVPGAAAAPPADVGAGSPAGAATMRELTTIFDVPLVTVAPLSLLTIQSVTIDVASPTEPDRVKVSIALGSVPTPPGLRTLIEAFASSIQPIQTG